ncbi:MAG: RNA methyltransferase [Planctomycetia bacterium]|nr:RNA methyltransferase [Planctomycetia bacterium]
MNRIYLTQADDPRLAPYRNLRERTLRGEMIFLAEGDLVVERLLVSRYFVESALVAESAFERVRPVLEEKGRADLPVFLVPDALVNMVAGFPFHQGVMAVGRREAVWELESLCPVEEPSRQRNPLRRVLAVVPDATKPENIGTVFRNCAALGADGVLLGPQACDPLSRRGLRVSMGGALQIPWLKTDDLERDLCRLKHDFHYRIYGTILSDSATELMNLTWSPRCAICFGNEYDGLQPEVLRLCDEEITIPMACGVDSLNLGVSAGIFLYEACRRGHS